MSESVIVQYVGFKAKALVREYSFVVRRAANETSEFTLTIGNEAFFPDVFAFKTLPRFARSGSIMNWLFSETILPRLITGSARQTWMTTAVRMHQGFPVILIGQRLRNQSSLAFGVASPMSLLVLRRLGRNCSRNSFLLDKKSLTT